MSPSRPLRALAAALVSRLSAALDRLSGPRLGRRCAALATVLALPALAVGWQSDDYVHQAILRGLDVSPTQASPVMSLYSYVSGAPARTRALQESGLLPWWTPEDARFRLWRPLSAATHLLDHAVAPGSAVFAHLHSLAWLALAVGLAALCFRALLGPTRIAALAALLYALDESHGLAVGWVANRNALLSAAFGFAALLAHHRWRAGGWRPGALLAPVLLAAGLLAYEATVGILAYLFAYTVFLDRGAAWRRLASLAPCGLVTLAWRASYDALGYGTSGSGLYVDPLLEPLRFLGAAAGRLPLLLVDQWTSFPSLVTLFLPAAAATALAAGAALLLAGLGWVLLRSLRGSRTAGFFACGMLLSALPLCSTLPANRLLWFVGFGGAGLCAQLVARAGLLGLRAPAGAPPAPRPAGALAAALLWVHVGLAGLLLPANAYAIRWIGERVLDPCEQVTPRGEGVRDRTVVFVNANDLCVSFVPFQRALAGEPPPRAVRILSSAVYDLEISRPDRRSLEIRPAGGFHSHPGDQLLREAHRPLPVGSRVELSGMSVEILEHNAEGLASAARFRFDVDLEDPSLCWRAYGEAGPGRFEPPAVGESLVLHAFSGIPRRPAPPPGPAPAGTRIGRASAPPSSGPGGALR